MLNFLSPEKTQPENALGQSSLGQPSLGQPSLGQPSLGQPTLGKPLVELINNIAALGYRFTTVTPLTHQRFLSRSHGIARDLKDVFGWNLPFAPNILPPLILDLMSKVDLLSEENELLRSRVRISTLDRDYFLHSAYPTVENDAVFFGPDTYRFARFIRQSMKIRWSQPEAMDNRKAIRILDIGCGSGAGGVVAVRAIPRHQPVQLFLNDINDKSLKYALANTQAAGIAARILNDDFFNLAINEYDLIISNPPYISDSEARLYRDGGAHFGLELSLRIARRALQCLAPNGQLLLYTGVAMDHTSIDPFLSELAPQLATGKYRWSYEEIDPDIFGEELERDEYRGIHRIAAIGLVVQRIK